MKRFSPRAIDGATSRTLLVVDDPESVVRQAVAAGATESSPVSNEHGWRLGRVVDPCGCTTSRPEGWISPDVRWLVDGAGEAHWYSAGDRLPVVAQAFPGHKDNDLVL
jgi:hypothetical protein